MWRGIGGCRGSAEWTLAHSASPERDAAGCGGGWGGGGVWGGATQPTLRWVLVQEKGPPVGGPLGRTDLLFLG
jgi:hypothetical protein